MSFQLPTCSRHQGSLAILQQISRGNLHVCKGIFTSGRSYQCCSRLLSRRCALRQGSLGARHKPGRQRLDVSATSLRIAFVSAEVRRNSRVCIHKFAVSIHHTTQTGMSMHNEVTEMEILYRLPHGAGQEDWVSFQRQALSLQ